MATILQGPPPPPMSAPAHRSRTLLLEAGLTTEQLEQELPRGENGRPFPPYQVPTSGRQIALDPQLRQLLTRPKRLGGWENIVDRRAAAVCARFPELLLARLAPDSFVSQLRDLGGILAEEIEKTRRLSEGYQQAFALTQQQLAEQIALLNRREQPGGFVQRVLGVAFDLVLCVRLFDQREVQALALEVAQAALQVQARCQAIVAEALRRLHAQRDMLPGTISALDQGRAERQQRHAAALALALPDFQFDHPAIVAHLVAQQSLSAEVLAIVLNPVVDQQALLDRLRANGQRKAREIATGLTFRRLLDLQRLVEGGDIAPEEANDLIFDQVLNDGAGARDWPLLEGHAAGRRVIIQATADGTPLSELAPAGGITMRTALYGLPSEDRFAFLEVVDGLEPAALAAVAQAHRAFEAAAADGEVNALVPALIPAAQAAGRAALHATGRIEAQADDLWVEDRPLSVVALPADPTQSVPLTGADPLVALTVADRPAPVLPNGFGEQ
jgi:hypothetical protein